MRASVTLITIGLSLGALASVASLTGCRNPPPPRVQVPTDSGGNPYTTYQHDDVKPMPPSATQSMSEPGAAGERPRSSDPVVAIPPGPPPVSQEYLEAYDRVGRPRMIVLVDRPAGDAPRSLVAGDYDMIERVVRETLAARGQVAVVAPVVVAEKVDQQQLTDIGAGRADALADAGGKLRADVVVQVKLTPPSGGANDTQLTATARNTRDAQQIATASAAVGNPPQRRQLDFAGRLLAERLVDELAGAWGGLADKQPPPTTGASSSSAAPAASTQPSTQK